MSRISRWVSVSSMTVPSEHLDGHGGGFAAADAQRGDAALQSVFRQRRHQSDQDARARGADRMAERAGAAMDIHLVMRQIEIAHRRHGDDGKGLVDLEQVHFAETPARPIGEFPDRGYW